MSQTVSQMNSFGESVYRHGQATADIVMVFPLARAE
jgi:hypothetical protein